MSERLDELMEQGRAALRRGDGPAARRLYQAVLEQTETPAALEGLGRAAYLELDFASAIPLWERAYTLHRDAGDGVGAVRMARQIAYMYAAFVGDAAVMNGWHARAKSILATTEETVESGWVALSFGLFETDRTKRNAFFREGLDIAERFGDPDLQFTTLAYLGASLVHGDQVEEGMMLLDEACAAIAGAEVDDFLVLEEIFCQLFSACEHAHDVARADQWIRIGDEIAARRQLPAVSAFCRTHYGGVLTAAGRWPEADAALTEAIRFWGLGFGPLRSGALIRLADLRVRQGRLEEAEQLLEGLDAWQEAARPLAALHFAHARYDHAAEVAERGLAEMEKGSAATGPLLSLLVDVHLALGAIDDADVAAQRLEDIAERHGSHYLVASAALARGRVCVASGVGDPRACLREALSRFARAQMPLELARARFELAVALVTESPDVALAEARSALDAFEQLEAARHADEAAALLRRLGGPARTGPKGSGPLTKREAEVLDLLGHGLSNPEIADRLYISRKTVEYHVGNVLAKLGLRSRAEAAAYAARTTPGGTRKPAPT